jgi:hypothetical protein
MTPAVAAPLVCDRCGAFTAGVSQVWAQKVCDACATRLRSDHAQVGLYPSGFIWAIGVLTNGTFSCALAALNWRRVGNPARAKTAWLMMAGCLIATILTLVIPKMPGALVLVASITGTRQALEGWKIAYDDHKRHGGKTASLLLAIAAIVGICFGLVVVVAIGMALTGNAE